MKKLLCLLVAAGLCAGCQCPTTPPSKDIVAKINNYEITRDEFEREFAESTYRHANTPQARREFLDNLINRKLILQDAQAQGLDKEQGFLKMIERFWEQSLLKMALDKKMKEMSSEGMRPEKQSEAINAWIEDLHKNAQIEIRKDLLDPEKGGL